MHGLFFLLAILSVCSAADYYFCAGGQTFPSIQVQQQLYIPLLVNMTLGVNNTYFLDSFDYQLGWSARVYLQFNNDVNNSYVMAGPLAQNNYIAFQNQKGCASTDDDNQVPGYCGSLVALFSGAVLVPCLSLTGGKSLCLAVKPPNDFRGSFPSITCTYQSTVTPPPTTTAAPSPTNTPAPTTASPTFPQPPAVPTTAPPPTPTPTQTAAPPPPPPPPFVYCCDATQTLAGQTCEALTMTQDTCLSAQGSYALCPQQTCQQDQSCVLYPTTSACCTYYTGNVNYNGFCSDTPTPLTPTQCDQLVAAENAQISCNPTTNPCWVGLSLQRLSPAYNCSTCQIDQDRGACEIGGCCGKATGSLQNTCLFQAGFPTSGVMFKAQCDAFIWPGRKVFTPGVSCASTGGECYVASDVSNND